MKKINSMNWTYETPSVNVLDILSEGVLCGSGPDSPSNGYGDNDLGQI